MSSSCLSQTTASKSTDGLLSKNRDLKDLLHTLNNPLSVKKVSSTPSCEILKAKSIKDKHAVKQNDYSSLLRHQSSQLLEIRRLHSETPTSQTSAAPVNFDKVSTSTKPINKTNKKAPEDGNVLKGFIDLLNKASSFWINKFSGADQEERTEGSEEALSEAQESTTARTSRSFSVNFPDTTASKDNDQLSNLMINEEERHMQNFNYQNSFYQSLQSNKLFTFTPNRISSAMLQWGTKHDHLLTKLVVEMKCDWKRIAKQFNKKSITPRFVRDRYRTITEPLLPKKTRFTHEEDLQIVKYYSQYGSNWKAIANFLPGRTSTMIKNRFYSSIKKKDLIPSMLIELSKRTESENWEEMLVEMNQSLNLKEEERRREELVLELIREQDKMVQNQQYAEEEKMDHIAEVPVVNLYENNDANLLSTIENEINNELNNKIFSPKREEPVRMQEESLGLDATCFSQFAQNNVPMMHNEVNNVSFNAFDEDTFRFLNSKNSFDQFAFFEFEDRAPRKSSLDFQFNLENQNNAFLLQDQSSPVPFQPYTEDLMVSDRDTPLKNTTELDILQNLDIKGHLMVKNEEGCDQALKMLNDKISSLMTLYHDAKLELNRIQENKRL